MLKRLLDIIVALTALITLGPIIGLLCLLIRRNLGSPVFFRQNRPGFKGHIFEMIKFRTMSDARDSDGELLPDSERLTRLGNFLRKSSLDELPELINVLKGDMSLVGPRPLLVEYLPLYSENQARRHDVRPGITGWAQVNGRNAISWKEKFELDVWYVENQSLWLDIRILWMTIWQVVRRKDTTAEGHVTMPKFTGTTKETTNH